MVVTYFSFFFFFTSPAALIVQYYSLYKLVLHIIHHQIIKAVVFKTLFYFTMFCPFTYLCLDYATVAGGLGWVAPLIWHCELHGGSWYYRFFRNQARPGGLGFCVPYFPIF